MTKAEDDGNNKHRRRKPSEKREMMKRRILDAAVQVMESNGVMDLNMGDLAHRLNMRSPSIYEYFEGRTGIYDALFEWGVDDFHSQVVSATNEARSFEEGCEAIFMSFRNFAQNQPVLFNLIFCGSAPDFQLSPATRKKMTEGMETGIEYLTQMMSNENIQPPVKLEEAALIVEILIRGMAMHVVAPHLRPASKVDEYEVLLSSVIHLLKQNSLGAQK